MQPCSRAARKWRENEEMKRKWRENEEMEREIHSQDFLILCLFPPSLSISYIKNCHILSQNVKYGTFVANVTKNLTYALWGNNSGSNSLRGSSASCAGLVGQISEILDDFALLLFHFAKSNISSVLEEEKQEVSRSWEDLHLVGRSSSWTVYFSLKSSLKSFPPLESTRRRSWSN